MTSAELLVDAFGRIRQVVHRGRRRPDARAVADLRRRHQVAVAAAGAAVLVTIDRQQRQHAPGDQPRPHRQRPRAADGGFGAGAGRLGPRAATVAACGSGGAGWLGCSASKACQQNEKAQHTSVQCPRIAWSLLTWKSAQPSSSQPIRSVAGQRVAVGPSPVRRDIPCLTEVGPRAVESQRRWRLLSTPDLGAVRVSRTRSASTTARRRQPSASWPRDVGVTVAARQYLVAWSMTAQIRQIPPRAVSNSQKSICASSPPRVPEEIDRLRRHPKHRDGGRSWRRLPPRGQVIGGLPGATEEGDGADPTGAGRGHLLTARADR